MHDYQALKTQDGFNKSIAQDLSDRTAQVSYSPPALQLKCSGCATSSGMDELQMKANPLQLQNIDEEELQRKANPLQLQNIDEEELQRKETPFQLKKGSTPIQRSSGSGSPMQSEVQSQMESSFETDFSNVRIHANSSTAPSVGALAYTQGNDIHFAPGQYSPNSNSGQELLGHELTHVVQQREGRVNPTGEVGGMPLNDDVSLEREADHKGRQAAQKKNK